MIRAASSPGALALLVLAGCVTLPDAQRDRAVPHAQQVAFEGARGPVSTGESDALLQGLEGPHGPSDVLDKHLAYEQSVNADSPLVLGNKLTLLQNEPDTYPQESSVAHSDGRTASVDFIR